MIYVLMLIVIVILLVEKHNKSKKCNEYVGDVIIKNLGNGKYIYYDENDGVSFTVEIDDFNNKNIEGVVVGKNSYGDIIFRYKKG